MVTRAAPTGVGLGFRFALADELLGAPRTTAQFVEIAPENYLGAGGRRARLLAAVAERFPVVCHGLCTDLAGAGPLDRELLLQLKALLQRLGARWYSDHLCLTHIAGAESHDLLPLPFTAEAVRRAAARIRDVQDLLGVPIAVENVSAYVRLSGELDEPAFVRAVVEDAGCGLLLDVNNVYVNATNFGFDARAYIDALPLQSVVELHVAGHDVEDDGLLLDTHGSAIADPVYDLLAYALLRIGRAPPVLLERDYAIPQLAVLEDELVRLQGTVEAQRGR